MSLRQKSWQFLAVINLVLAIVILQTHCNLTSVEIDIEADAKKVYSKNTIQRRYVRLDWELHHVVSARVAYKD